MTGRDLPVDAGVSAPELEAARRLADALETGRTGVDAVAELAVARLLEAVSPAAAHDELAARRLRSELISRARGRARSRAARRVAAVAALAAAAALLAVLLGRSPAPPGEDVLAAREEAARAAVVAVARPEDARDESSRRIAAVSEGQWRDRVAARLESGRFEELAADVSPAPSAGRGWAEPRATRTVPAPGGRT